MDKKVELTMGRPTRATKAEQTNMKSAITDHCKINNNVMDWEMTRAVCTERDRYQLWIKEAIKIGKWDPRTMNRDEGPKP